MLIFTEFADTARYLAKHSARPASTASRRSTARARRTAPTSSRASRPTTTARARRELAGGGQDEIRVLISTDVLSEGLNLQDATRLINYDIHWNPVRLMQRIGRVDRRMNPEIEARLEGRPPETGRRPRDGRVLELPAARRAERDPLALHEGHPEDAAHLEDDRHRGQEAPHARGRLRGAQGVQPGLRRHDDAVEGMHLEYQRLLDETPGLADTLERLPGRSLQRQAAPDEGLRGAFFCFALPALDTELGEFTEEAGTTRWYFYDAERDAILEDPPRSSTRSARRPRHHASARPSEPTCSTMRDDGPEAHQEHLPQARRRARRRRSRRFGAGWS